MLQSIQKDLFPKSAKRYFREIVHGLARQQWLPTLALWYAHKGIPT